MTPKDKTFTIKEALEKGGFGRFHWYLLSLVGLIDGVYSCQALLPTFLIPILDDVWDIESPLDSMIGIVFFLGTIVGNLVWSKIADIYGRRSAIIFGSIVLAASTTATGAMSNITGVLICRFLTGCGTPTAVSYTLFVEFSPLLDRAKSVLLVTIFFTFGGLFSVFLAWIILPTWGETIGWRIYVLSTSIPGWIAVIVSFWIPESPRYWTTMGEFEKAEKIIRKVLKVNRVKAMEGRLATENEKRISKRGQILDLFVPEYRWTSVVLGINLINSLMMYYGIVYLSERLFVDYSLYMCEVLTTLSEIPGLIFGSLTMNIIGRKNMIIWTMSFATIAFTTMVLLWRYALNDSWAWVIIVISVFLARCSTCLHSITVKLYMSEYYPTAIRATAVGSGLGFAKFGAIAGTFVSEDLDIVTSSTVFTFVSLIGFATSLLLQDDTTHRALTDDVDRRDSRPRSLTKGQSKKEYVLVSSV